MASSVRLSRRHADALLRFVDAVECDRTPMEAEAIDRLRDGIRPKRSKPSRLASRKTKKARREEKRSDWATVRAAVMFRAGEFCEAPSCQRRTDALTPDHFFGRKRHECIETVWALCVHCDRNKTTNSPSAQEWAETFYVFAKANGYPKGMRLAQRRIDYEKYRAKAKGLPDFVPQQTRAESLATTGRYPQEPLNIPGGEGR